MEQQEFNIKVAGSLERIETKIDDLAGPTGRITKLEKAADRQWWYTVGIAPIIAIGHTILKHFKINV